MRKTILIFLTLLMFGAVVHAQGFITEKEKEQRRGEVRQLAGRLFRAKSTLERFEIRKEMIKGDVIRASDGTRKGDGFSVAAFVWLYRQGEGKDLNARLHAVIGLASVKSSAARDPLVQALDDPNEAIQLRVIQAIDTKAIVRAGKAVVLKLRSPNANVVTAAAKCLADLGLASDDATGPMIELMVQSHEKLVMANRTDPRRAGYHRTIEVLGRACGQLIAGVTWSPGPSLRDLGKEIAKFTHWWNKKHLAGLRDPRHDIRRQALDKMRITADRAAFLPVLQAVVKEFARLQATGNFTQKQQAQQFIVAASVMLSRISGKGVTLRPTSNTQEIEAAVKGWQNWWKVQMETLASPR